MPAVAEQLLLSLLDKPLIINRKGIFVPNKIIRLSLYFRTIARPLFALQPANTGHLVNRWEATALHTLLAHQIFRFFGILCFSVIDARAVKSATVITPFYGTALA
jgi:hypothetical protein